MAQLCSGVRRRQVVQVAIALHKQRCQAQQQPSSAKQTQLLARVKDETHIVAVPHSWCIRPLLPALKGMLAELRCSPVIALARSNHDFWLAAQFVTASSSLLGLLPPRAARDHAAQTACENTV